MKIKSSVEKKYHTKHSDNQVQQTFKQNRIAYENILHEIQILKDKDDRELKCHFEIMNFLKREIERLKELKEHWYEKYRKDTDEKTQELEQLKAMRNKDLERMQELTVKYAEYEQVCVSERICNEKLQLERESERMRLKATVRIQSWWRGVMVCIRKYVS